jgi:uncharacterized protein YbjT (DUF2867 family)
VRLLIETEFSFLAFQEVSCIKQASFNFTTTRRLRVATILLTGATGTVGSLVTEKLVERGARVRALVRDREAARARLGAGVELVAGDLMDPTSLPAALEGVDVASLATAPGPAMAEQEGNFADAAVAAKLPRLVHLMGFGSSLAPDEALFAWKLAGAARVAESGIPATVLQPNVFMSNLLWDAPAVQQGTISSIMADGRLSLIDPDDVADLTVAALTDERHAGSTWEVGGPEALSYDEIAATFSKVLDRPVTHIRLDLATFRAGAAEAGVPDFAAESLVTVARLVQEGSWAVGDEVIQRILGRPAQNLQSWVERHRAAFDPALATAN